MTSSNVKNVRGLARLNGALFAACFAAALFVVVGCMPAYAASGSTDEQTTLRPTQSTAGKQAGKPATAAAQDPYAKEVTKRGSTVLVSREFANAVKKDNGLLLSKAAVKARADKAGQLTGYQLVTIDRGSTISKMGFKPGDVITAINGIPARELEANRSCLQSATKYDVDFLRKDNPRRLNVEIK